MIGVGKDQGIVLAWNDLRQTGGETGDSVTLSLSV